MQAGGPAVGELVQAPLLGLGQLADALLGEQGGLFVGSHAQVGEAELGQLALDAGGNEVKVRALARADHQVKVVGCQIDQSLDQSEGRQGGEELQVLDE
ncbi:hypothetical protein D3C85_1570270 [compost metagenome]